jgi:hypothetical protein
MNFLLRLKAWQMFLFLMVFFVLPSLFPLVFIHGGFLFEFTFLFLVVFLLWVYSIGVKMNALIPAAFRPGTSRFKIYCLVAPVSAGFILGLSFFSVNLGVNTGVYLILVLTSVIAYFYSIFSVFMFAARMLKTVVLGYPANKSDAIAEFFCIWMFPIGVWIIQPMVNKVLAKQDENNGTFN